MVLFLAGLQTWLALLAAGCVARAPLIVGFFASLPFGATAFASLPALGGSSPLIYTLFAIAILLAAMLRRRAMAELGRVFAGGAVAWAAAGLAVYAAASAYILPRLLGGTTTAFVPIDGLVTEVPLAPASGNITQTAYFELGILLFLAFRMLLLQGGELEKMRRGFLAFVIVHALLGWVDFTGKLMGLGDVLDAIRTASYSMLADNEQSGFFRIVGGCPETSSFAAYGLAALGFAFTYWREAGSRVAGLAAAAMLVLLIMSTSSTAYVVLGIMCAFMLAGMARAAMSDSLKRQDLILAAAALTILALLLGAHLHNPRLMAPFAEMFQTMVLEKASSSSGQERSYWNMRSLMAFVETHGLGLGFGSSRSSSWPVSVISQLGVVGASLMGVLVLALARGMHGLRPRPEETEVFALCRAVRACAGAFLLAASLAGSSADPGVLFFACLAVVIACRRHVLAGRREGTARGRLPSIDRARGFPTHFGSGQAPRGRSEAVG